MIVCSSTLETLLARSLTTTTSSTYNTSNPLRIQSCCTCADSQSRYSFSRLASVHAPCPVRGPFPQCKQSAPLTATTAALNRCTTFSLAITKSATTAPSVRPSSRHRLSRCCVSAATRYVTSREHSLPHVTHGAPQPQRNFANHCQACSQSRRNQAKFSYHRLLPSHRQDLGFANHKIIRPVPLYNIKLFSDGPHRSKQTLPRIWSCRWHRSRSRTTRMGLSSLRTAAANARTAFRSTAVRPDAANVPTDSSRFLCVFH